MRLIIAWCMFFLANNAFALPETFTVSTKNPDGVDVLYFSCKPTKNGGLLCDIRQVSVSYYKWKWYEVMDKKRCRVSASTFNGQYFAPSGNGRWSRPESGAFCNAAIRTDILKLNGKTTVQDVTVFNMEPKDSICSVHGESGTIKQYEQASMLDVTQMDCSSLVISP